MRSEYSELKERLRNKEAQYERILINRFRRRKKEHGQEKRSEKQEKHARAQS